MKGLFNFLKVFLCHEYIPEEYVIIIFEFLFCLYQLRNDFTSQQPFSILSKLCSVPHDKFEVPNELLDYLILSISNSEHKTKVIAICAATRLIQADAVSTEKFVSSGLFNSILSVNSFRSNDEKNEYWERVIILFREWIRHRPHDVHILKDYIQCFPFQYMMDNFYVDQKMCLQQLVALICSHFPMSFTSSILSEQLMRNLMEQFENSPPREPFVLKAILTVIPEEIRNDYRLDYDILTLK